MPRAAFQTRPECLASDSSKPITAYLGDNSTVARVLSVSKDSAVLVPDFLTGPACPASECAVPVGPSLSVECDSAAPQGPSTTLECAEGWIANLGDRFQVVHCSDQRKENSNITIFKTTHHDDDHLNISNYAEVPSSGWSGAGVCSVPRSPAWSSNPLQHLSTHHDTPALRSELHQTWHDGHASESAVPQGPSPTLESCRDRANEGLTKG